MSILSVDCNDFNIENEIKNETDNINNNDVSVEKPAYLAWYESVLAPPEIPELPDPDNVFEYIYQIPPEFAPELPLSDVSSKDSIWDEQRTKTATVGDIYAYNAEFERYSERMSDCSTFLSYGFNENGIKLKHANFCRVRHCPVCQWRKSLLWKSNMYVAYEEIKEKYPTHRWLFLTLTAKNCDITDLRKTIKHMNKSWERLTKRVMFTRVVEGWIKTTEITKGINDTAHPHFHVMLLVKPSYFAKNYIKQAEWAELWRDVLRVDYEPIIDIRAIKNKSAKKDFDADQAVKNAIMETLKYAVKPDDLIGDGSKKSNEWFYELTRQTFKLRFIASGGALKNALKRDDDITDNDMIKTSDEDDDIGEVDERRIVFTYRKIKQKYVYAPQYNQ